MKTIQALRDQVLIEKHGVNKYNDWDDFIDDATLTEILELNDKAWEAYAAQYKNQSQPIEKEQEQKNNHREESVTLIRNIRKLYQADIEDLNIYIKELEAQLKGQKESIFKAYNWLKDPNTGIDAVLTVLRKALESSPTEQPEAQKPPQKEKFGWEDTTSFDNQGGWTIEGGEEAYYEALAAWEHIQHAKPEQNQPQPEKCPKCGKQKEEVKPQWCFDVFHLISNNPPSKSDLQFVASYNRDNKYYTTEPEAQKLTDDELKALSSIGIIAKNWYAVTYNENQTPFAMFNNEDYAKIYRDQFCATAVIVPYPMQIKDYRKSQPIEQPVKEIPAWDELREALNILQERIDNPNAHWGATSALKEAWNLISDFITKNE